MEKKFHDISSIKINDIRPVLFECGINKKQFQEYFQMGIGKYKLINSNIVKHGEDEQPEQSNTITSNDTEDWRAYHFKKMMAFGLPPSQSKLIIEQAPSKEVLSSLVNELVSKIILNATKELKKADTEMLINSDSHNQIVAQCGFNNSIELLEFVNTIYQNGYSPNANNLPSDVKKKLRQLIDVGYMEIDKASGGDKVPIPTRDLLRLKALTAKV